jgi:hypothetical protein
MEHQVSLLLLDQVEAQVQVPGCGSGSSLPPPPPIPLLDSSSSASSSVTGSSSAISFNALAVIDSLFSPILFNFNIEIDAKVVENNIKIYEGDNLRELFSNLNRL